MTVSFTRRLSDMEGMYMEETMPEQGGIAPYPAMDDRYRSERVGRPQGVGETVMSKPVFTEHETPRVYPVVPVKYRIECVYVDDRTKRMWKSLRNIEW